MLHIEYICIVNDAYIRNPTSAVIKNHQVDSEMPRFGADLLMELALAIGNYPAGSTPKATVRNRPTPAILFGEPAGPHLGNGNGWMNDRQE